MKRFFPLAVVMLLTMLSSCQKNTVTFEQFEVKDKMLLCDTLPDSLSIEIHLEYPTALRPDSVRNIVQESLKLHLFGEPFVSMEPQQAMEAYVAVLKTEYRNNALPMLEEYLKEEQDAEEYAPFFCEEQYLSGTVMGIEKDILSYGIERYVYLGGPHGSNYRQFVNYDLHTGRVVHEEDLFVENYEEALTELLLKNMVLQNDDIELIEDLEQAGYNVDDIHPNDNFYLAAEGITYVFNPYDIAPYSLGETEILIPWTDAQEIVRAEVLEESSLPFSLKKLF